jgi:hypothetical protein
MVGARVPLDVDPVDPVVDPFGFRPPQPAWTQPAPTSFSATDLTDSSLAPVASRAIRQAK